MPAWEEAEELRFLNKAQDGNSEAFGELYTHYVEGVFRFLYFHLDNRLDAEDLTEEVFYRAWRALPQYRHQGLPFAAFLFRIARNALTDFYRKAKRAKHLISLDEAGERIGVDGNISEGRSEKAEKQELVSLLGSLKPEYQMVISLRFFSGMSPEETAKIMKRSVGAVRVLQYRALAAVRSKMNQD